MSGKSANVMAKAGAKKRVLFVCTENRVRSLTAQQMYGGRPDLEVQSAGISEYARVPLTQDLFEWADEVFVFSKRQQKALETRYRDSFNAKPVICLHLPDRFQFNRPKLVIKLTGKLKRYLGQPASNEQTSTQSPAQVAKLPPLQLSGLRLGQIARWSMVWTLGAWLCHSLVGLLQIR